MNSLEIDSINLSFDGRKILSNIYLKCHTKDIVALLGRNGSGKSSLLKIIFGSLKGENQSVRLNGKYSPILFKVPRAISYLPQDGFVPNYFCFEDLVKIFRLSEKLDVILSIEEIDKYKSTRFKHLSGGIKKLMEIMTILYSSSKFLLLDEPFSFLAPVLVEKIIPHIESQSLHKGIILTDHQYETVLSICNKYYVLNNTAITLIKDVSQLNELGYLN